MQSLVKERESKRASIVLMGNYMPFAGVKYYTLLDEQDISGGKNTIGAIGWRLHRTTVETVAKAPDTAGFEMNNVEKLMLAEIDIFRNLDNEQIKKVEALGQRVAIPEGTLLGQAGELVSHLFIILEGQAELTANSGIGPITVRIAGTGESFPLAVLIGSGTLITSVIAMTEMTLLTIPRSRLLALCSEDTDLVQLRS